MDQLLVSEDDIFINKCSCTTTIPPKYNLHRICRLHEYGKYKQKTKCLVHEIYGYKVNAWLKGGLTPIKYKLKCKEVTKWKKEKTIVLQPLENI